ncbi:hypothetical protein ACWF94_03530 [Streptomyces sp. NPDC055078]
MDSPQVSAAQALEDAGLLLSPEVAAEIAEAVAVRGALPVPLGHAGPGDGLSSERLQDIRECDLGDWYRGAWRIEGIDPDDPGEPAYCTVTHVESGTVLATLPDWAGLIAVAIAEWHEAVPELLAEVDRLRARIAVLEPLAAGPARLVAEVRAGASVDQVPPAVAPARLRATLLASGGGLAEPYGCGVCGIPEREHGRRWHRDAGMHSWQAPSDVQILARMRARRTARKGGGSS